MKQKENYLILDGIRGLAALLVFIGHLRAIVFTNLDASTVTSTIGKLFLFITGFGHQSVIVFFVLSGFFIAKTVDNDLQKNTWSIKKYFIDRSVRLWVVLIPALIIGGLLDKIGLQYFGNEITYKGGITFLPDVNPANKLGITTFLGNLFFVQTIFTSTFGSNGPLWSLANEFWYYILYALLVAMYQYRKNIYLTIFSLLAIGVICYFTFNNILLYFAIWFLGVITYYIRKKYWVNLNVIRIITLFFLIAVLTLIRLQKFPEFCNDYTLAVVVSLFIWANAFSVSTFSYLKKPIQALSNISYSLYLIHIPICLFLSTMLGCINLQFSIKNITVWMLIAIIVLVLVYMIWYLFERNTSKIKKTLISNLNFK